MKRIILVVLVLLLLSACGAQPEVAVPETEPATLPPVTQAPTEPSTEPPVTEPVITECKFRQKVKNDLYYIFKEPDHGAKIARVLPKGVYTIVKETYDANGHHWGKLKSGAGWICLTDIQENQVPIKIDEAEKSFLNSGEYTKHGNVNGKYTIPVLLMANQPLTEVAVYNVDHNTSKKTGSPIAKRETLETDQSMVVWLDFGGDCAEYQIRCVDAAGTTYKYRISENLSDSGGINAYLIK